MMMMTGLMHLNTMRKIVSKKRSTQQKASETALLASYTLDYYDFDNTKVGHNFGAATIIL